MGRVTITIEDVERFGQEGIGFRLESDPPLPESDDDEATNAQIVATHLIQFYQGYLAPQLSGRPISTSVREIDGTETVAPAETAKAVASLPQGFYCPFPELVRPIPGADYGPQVHGDSVSFATRHAAAQTVEQDGNTADPTDKL